MKRILSLKKKVISLLLVLIMLMALSSSVFASGTTASVATANLSTSLALESLAIEGLESLASGAVSAIGGKGMNAAYAAIFGDDTANIMSSLDDMNGKIDGINDRLVTITTQLDDLKKYVGQQVAIDNLCDDLDDYSRFIRKYRDVYDTLSDDIDSFSNNPDLTKEYLTSIYFCSRDTMANYYVGSDTIIRATLNLGSELTAPQSIKSGYNIFGIFDSLDKYTHRWEHQGYEDRQNFRDVSIATYILYSSLSQLACNTVMEDNSQPDSIRLQAGNMLNNLKKNAITVMNMCIRCAVVEHPDLRIYRNLWGGTDQYAFYINVSKSFMYSAPSRPIWEEFDLNVDPNYYMASMIDCYTPWGKRNTSYPYARVTEIWTHQAAEETYTKIYTDYGGNKTLYDIFFDANEGNFNNENGLPKGTSFVGNYYKQTEWYNGIRIMDCHIISNEGQTTEFQLGEKTVNTIKGGRNYVSDQSFFSVYMYLGNVNQGSLKSSNTIPETESDGLISGMGSSYNLPYSGSVTLSVEEQAGCTYQWMVNKGDSFKELTGETNTTYTIPTLEASMNGYQYSCYIIKNGAVDTMDYIIADPVTLSLTGEGVIPPVVSPAVTVHEVANENELTAAIEKVNKGEWDEHTLKLTANIEYSLPISIIEYGVHIDLNGYTLNVNVDGTAEPNIEPEGSTAAIAAVYVDNYGFLDIMGDGALNVVADDGAEYGVYAANYSSADITTVTSTNCVSAVYATDGSTVTADSVSAAGEYTYGIECFEKSTVNVSGSVTASGKSSGGVYVDGWNESASVSIGGDITVSGENSYGAFVSGESAILNVDCSITVTGGGAGVVDGNGSAVVGGNITSSASAVNAWDGADVTVKGNVISTDEDAAAVSSSGADVHIFGDVYSTGTGISATSWDLENPAVGANVTVDGNINASTHLMIENLPVEESKHTENTTKEGYYTYTDGTSIVWAKPGSFVKTADPAPVPTAQTEDSSNPASNPQTGDSSLPLTLWLLLGVSALALATLTLRRRKSV